MDLYNFSPTAVINEHFLVWLGLCYTLKEKIQYYYFVFFTERFPLFLQRGGCVRDKTQCGVLTAYLSSVSLQLHLEIQQLFQNQKIYEELFFYAAFPKLFFSTHRLSWVWGLFFYIIHVLLCFFFLCLPLVLPSLS